jgi:hypothetical protein
MTSWFAVGSVLPMPAGTTPTRMSPVALSPYASTTVYVKLSVPATFGNASYSRYVAPTVSTRPSLGPLPRPTSRTESPLGSMFCSGISMRCVVPARTRPVTSVGTGAWLTMSGEMTLKRTTVDDVRPRLSLTLYVASTRPGMAGATNRILLPSTQAPPGLSYRVVSRFRSRPTGE